MLSTRGPLRTLERKIGKQFTITSQRDGTAFLGVLEKLQDLDLQNIAKQLKSSQEWKMFTGSVGNKKPNEAEMSGALSALARILENQIGPSRHTFTRRGD